MEECPRWTGDGCACAVLGLPPTLVAPTGDSWGSFDDAGERCPACRRKWSKHGDARCAEQAVLVVTVAPLTPPEQP